MTSDEKSIPLNKISEHIVLTDFLEGSNKKRQEALAQPEAICEGCPNCVAECSCGGENSCPGCNGQCLATCEFQCNTITPMATNQTSGQNYLYIGNNQAANGIAQVTNQTLDHTEHHESSWWTFFGWGG